MGRVTVHVYKEALILLRHCSLHGGYDSMRYTTGATVYVLPHKR